MFDLQARYASSMSRILCISLALLLALPFATSGAPAHKQHVKRWHGYGFLPGYHQPLNNAVPIYGRKGAVTGERDYETLFKPDWTDQDPPRPSG